MRRDRSVVISLAQWERGTGNVKGRAVVFVLLRVHVCVAVSHFKNTILLYSVAPLLQKQTRIPPKSTLCYPDRVAVESCAALMARPRMKRTGLQTCSESGGETLRERGQRWRSAHPWLHSSCHRPTSSRITWNPKRFFSFFFFPSFERVRRKTSTMRWPLLMGCVTRRSKRWSGIKHIRRQ